MKRAVQTVVPNRTRTSDPRLRRTADRPLIAMNSAPGWRTAGWLILVTITGQLLGWLLVAFYTPRLPSDVGSALLLLTPIGAVALGALVLGERPSVLQLAGCAIVLVASYAGTARR